MSESIESIYEGLNEDEPKKPKGNNGRNGDAPRSEKQKANDNKLNSTRPAKFEEHYLPTQARMTAFLDALPANNWCIAATARQVGMTPSAYYKWIQKDPEFRELVESQRKMVFEYAFDLARLGMMGDLGLDARDRIQIALQLLRLNKVVDANVEKNGEGDTTSITITFV